MNNTLLSIGIAILLAFFGLLFAPMFIDWSPYKQDFENEISAYLGKDIDIRGDINVQFIPELKVSINSFNIQNPIGQNSNIDIAEITLNVDILHFLTKQAFKAKKIELYGPVLRVTGSLEKTGEDITQIFNASFIQNKSENINLPKNNSALSKLSIQGGRIAWQEKTGLRSKQILDINLKGEYRSISKTFQLSGLGAFPQGPIEYDLLLHLNQLKQNLPYISARALSLKDGVEFTYKGGFGFQDQKPKAIGELTTTLYKNTTTLEKAKENFLRITSAINFSGASMDLDTLVFEKYPEYGQLGLTGQANIKFGEISRLTSDLKLGIYDFGKMPSKGGVDFLYAYLKEGLDNPFEQFFDEQSHHLTIKTARIETNNESETLTNIKAEFFNQDDRLMIKTLSAKLPGLSFGEIIREDKKIDKNSDIISINISGRNAFAFLEAIDFKLIPIIDVTPKSSFIFKSQFDLGRSSPIKMVDITLPKENFSFSINELKNKNTLQNTNYSIKLSAENISSSSDLMRQLDFHQIFKNNEHIQFDTYIKNFKHNDQIFSDLVYKFQIGGGSNQALFDHFTLKQGTEFNLSVDWEEIEFVDDIDAIAAKNKEDQDTQHARNRRIKLMLNFANQDIFLDYLKDTKIPKETKIWLQKILPQAFLSNAQNLSDRSISFEATTPPPFQSPYSQFDFTGNIGDILISGQVPFPLKDILFGSKISIPDEDWRISLFLDDLSQFISPIGMDENINDGDLMHYNPVEIEISHAQDITKFALNNEIIELQGTLLNNTHLSFSGFVNDKTAFLSLFSEDDIAELPKDHSSFIMSFEGNITQEEGNKCLEIQEFALAPSKDNEENLNPFIILSGNIPLYEGNKEAHYCERLDISLANGELFNIITNWYHLSKIVHQSSPSEQPALISGIKTLLSFALKNDIELTIDDSKINSHDLGKLIADISPQNKDNLDIDLEFLNPDNSDIDAKLNIQAIGERLAIKGAYNTPKFALTSPFDDLADLPLSDLALEFFTQGKVEGTPFKPDYTLTGKAEFDVSKLDERIYQDMMYILENITLNQPKQTQINFQNFDFNAVLKNKHNAGINQGVAAMVKPVLLPLTLLSQDQDIAFKGSMQQQLYQINLSSTADLKGRLSSFIYVLSLNEVLETSPVSPSLKWVCEYQGEKPICTYDFTALRAYFTSKQLLDVEKELEMLKKLKQSQKQNQVKKNAKEESNREQNLVENQDSTNEITETVSDVRPEETKPTPKQQTTPSATKRIQRALEGIY